jgi:hypothetical protein
MPVFRRHDGGVGVGKKDGLPRRFAARNDGWRGFGRTKKRGAFGAPFSVKILQVQTE